MNPVAEDILMHYGISKLDGAPGRGSGRYPLGSGENPNQRSGDFLSRVEKLRRENFTFTDENGKEWTGDMAIAKSLGLNSSQFRTQLSLANSERRAGLVKTAKELREQGLSLNEIAKQMGYTNDSSVRSLLNENAAARMNLSQKTADFLREQVAQKGMIDVGAGVERELGISKEKLKEALYILELEGYPTYGGGVPQVTNPGKQTNIQVLCPPGTEHREIYNFGEVHSLRDYVSHDGGDTFDRRFVYPKSMDPSRLAICYAEDGGTKKDGVIEIRRGVDDLSLGESRYAQVRILVGGDRYIKGMAVYADDLPDGLDVRFNTNKSNTVPKMEVLKKIKDDPDNPFGSLIKAGVVDPDDPSSREGGQSYYYDSNGKKQLSLINKRAEEGDWGEWADKLPSQFLSKQSKQLIDRQLTLASDDKKAEFDEICSLTNPTVRKKLLQSFADDCDAAAIHLKAAALPRQKYQVILPLTSIKDTEVYAPNFDDGEKVALIRYPHGGTFEIPILTVNNKLTEGRRVLGTAPKDAIGINSKVAERLSGADFDGDTVMVIPTGGKVKITSTPPLKGLVGFDPKLEYGSDSSKTDSNGVEHYYRGGKEFRVMRNTQTEMGIISNLITDMTLRGATQDELARAVRHSMVVIDAEKHHLDYKQSEADNQIAALKSRYQGTREADGSYHEGASTLISRAKSEVQVLKRRGSPIIDRETGEQSWKEVHETYVDKKDGKTKVRTQTSTKMAETRDAMTLVSDARTPAELAYAKYANEMKSLANKARLEMVNTGKIAYSSSARTTYQKEVDDLMSQLNVALLNAPRERQAQVMANATVNAKKQDNPDMTKAELKKERQRALASSRAAVGAGRELVKITDRQWEAIQAGAVSENVLKQILDNSDIDKVKQLAMPRTTTALTPAKINKLKVMYDSGNYTTYQIAQSLGISSSTVSRYLNGEE